MTNPQWPKLVSESLIMKSIFNFSDQIAGLPHTPGSLGNFQIIEISENFDIFFKLREVLNFFFSFRKVDDF